MLFPESLRYSADHEWVLITGLVARIGITDYAQQSLGDVVFVQVPKLGQHVVSGESVSEVESTKSVSDVYSPITGSVVAVNELLSSNPELVNSDPYGEGWLCELEIDDPSQLDGLLDAAGYQALVEG
jgi:glycine cleavage system H protein